jgi:hypothetical protein
MRTKLERNINYCTKLINGQMFCESRISTTAAEDINPSQYRPLMTDMDAFE